MPSTQLARAMFAIQRYLYSPDKDDTYLKRRIQLILLRQSLAHQLPSPRKSR